MRILVGLLMAASLGAENLDEGVRTAVAGFPGTVSLFAKNLDSGKSYGLRADGRVRTASTIKLGIMSAIFAEVEAGRARWTEEFTLRDSAKVAGSGVLTEFSDSVRLPLRDLLHLMIVVSDNTATNLLLDRFPADLVNDHLDRLGLKQTRCLRKILAGDKATGISRAGRDPELQKYGIGVTTPREMVTLLEKVEPSSAMVAILKRQQYKDGIGRHMPYPVASKSGALERLRSDVGIVYAPGARIVLAITCDDMAQADWSPDNAGNLMISRLAGLLVDALK